MTWRLPDTYHSAGTRRGTATLQFYEGRDILGGTRTPSLLIRSPLLGFAGFLTCADFHHIASSGSRIPGFPGFPLADPLAACGSSCDLPEPGSRFSGVYG